MSVLSQGGRGKGWTGSLGLKLINNKVPLNSTGNYIQYPMINREWRRISKWKYIYITESVCCTAEINPTL